MIGIQPNTSGIVLSLVAYVALGFAWYSPALFGNQWLKLSGLAGKSKEQMKKQMGPAFTTMVVSEILTVILLDLFLQSLGVQTVGDAVLTGVLIWLAFTGSIFATCYAFSGKPMKLFLIDACYPLLAFVLASVILVTL